VLAPWPNRIDEGRYRFGDHEAHAALDEPLHNCAIHGLVRWLPWSLEQRSPDSVELSITVHPQPGYPFRVRLALLYRLADDGLIVECSARNQGGEDLPFGIGFHPYLEPGPAGLELSRLFVPATRQVLLDARGIPTGKVSEIGPGNEVALVTTPQPPAEGGPPASDEPRTHMAASPVGQAVLDVCLTELGAGEDRRWRARLDPAPNSGVRQPVPVEIWADERFRYCEVFTADTLPGPGRRRGLAVEPMTCPPNALRSGTDLVVLVPDEQFQASFGIRPLG
jgi:aldose 1-epimerase